MVSKRVRGPIETVGIVLLTDARRVVEQHALVDSAVECCGLLVGRRDGPVTTVVSAVRSRNRAERPRDRFAIAPEAILEVMRELPAGERIVGFYHSHPDGTARPSRYDREGSWPDASSLIVGVDRGKVVAVRSWRWSSDTDGLLEEAILEPSR